MQPQLRRKREPDIEPQPSLPLETQRRGLVIGMVGDDYVIPLTKADIAEIEERAKGAADFFASLSTKTR